MKSLSKLINIIQYYLISHLIYDEKIYHRPFKQQTPENSIYSLITQSRKSDVNRNHNIHQVSRMWSAELIPILLRDLWLTINFLAGMKLFDTSVAVFQLHVYFTPHLFPVFDFQHSFNFSLSLSPPFFPSPSSSCPLIICPYVNLQKLFYSYSFLFIFCLGHHGRTLGDLDPLRIYKLGLR